MKANITKKKVSSLEFYNNMEALLKGYKERKKKKAFRQYGIVLSVQDGIVLGTGLKKVGASEVVKFKSGIQGMVSTLEREHVRICLMGPETKVRPGSTISRLHKFISIPVGYSLLGRVVDSLGRPLDDKGSLMNVKKPVPQMNKIAEAFITYNKKKGAAPEAEQIVQKKGKKIIKGTIKK